MPARKKYCPDCKQDHPVTDFGRNRQSADGLHYYCKLAAAARQRRWAASHPEKIRSMRSNYLKRIYALNAARNPYE